MLKLCFMDNMEHKYINYSQEFWRKRDKKTLHIYSSNKTVWRKIIFLLLILFVLAQNQHICQDQSIIKYPEKKYITITLNLQLKLSLSLSRPTKEELAATYPQVSLFKPPTFNPISIENTLSIKADMSWGVWHIFLTKESIKISHR
mgnify:CR=1 FL=1